MNRITQTFRRLQLEGKSAMIAFITAGDPTLKSTVKIALELEKAGVDILELGIPFSDPLADGPIIQAASNRALKAGASVQAVIELVREIRRESELPIVLFTYLNPVYIYGFDRFQSDASEAGADGLLLLDLPPQEADRNAELATKNGVDHLLSIRLIAPTTPTSRLLEITNSAEGFIYYVSREGVTGEQSTLSNDIAGRLEVIRSVTKIPLVVGFGISTPEQAAVVGGLSDGVVIGSAIVRQIGEIGDVPDLPKRIGEFVRPIAEAVSKSKHD